MHPETISWLKYQLGRSSKRRDVLLFAHHPLSKLPIDYVKMSFSFENYQTMANLLRDSGAVALWAAGHVHRDSEYEVRTQELRDTGVKGNETGAAKDGELRLITVWGATQK